MSKGSRETRTLEFFEECANLSVARAILRACTETVERREREAGTRKPQQARKQRAKRTNSAAAGQATGAQTSFDTGRMGEPQ